MGEIDVAFVLSDEHKPQLNLPVATEIPTIDLSQIASVDRLSDGDDEFTLEKLGDLVKEVAEACKKTGFFKIINHGFPMEKIQRLDRASREFFHLPMEEKRKVRRDGTNPMGYMDTELTKNVRDWKEVFDYSTHDLAVNDIAHYELEANQWPEKPHEFKEAAEEYGREAERLGFKLLALIAMSLGLPANRLDDYFKPVGSTFVRINRYPPCPSPDLTLGAGRHKDPGAITILTQDDVGGLQVKRKPDGQWFSVNPTPDALVINIGDIIQIWSNEKYESVEHRVAVNSEKERISVVTFFNPSHHCIVKPLEELIDEKNPPKYKECIWGAFIATRRRGNYFNLKIDDIQVTDFKTT